MYSSLECTTPQETRRCSMRGAAPHGNLRKGTGTNLRRGSGRKRHESKLRPRHSARLQGTAFDAAPRFVAILNLRFRAPGAKLARIYSPPSPDGGGARALTCRHRRTLKVAGGWALVFIAPDGIGVHHEEVRHRRLILEALRRRVVRCRRRARHETRGGRGTRGRRGHRAAARTGQRASRAPPGRDDRRQGARDEREPRGRHRRMAPDGDEPGIQAAARSKSPTDRYLESTLSPTSNKCLSPF